MRMTLAREADAGRTETEATIRPMPHAHILDDELEVARLVQAACLRAGLTSTAFDTIEEFRNAQEANGPDVIFLDLGLRGGTGVDVLRYLASRRCGAAVYLMSGVDERLLATVERLGLSYGLDIRGAVPKPFRLNDISAVLADMAGRTAPPPRRASPEEQLHRAIIGGELLLHYQPKIEISNGALVGCEALVRWQHPQRGLVPPGEFLPVAEETGLIVPLTHWVVAEAVRQAAEWRRAGLAIRVAVNVPADMLMELSLPRMIERVLADAGVDGSCLTLEVTEAAAMKDLVTAIDVLARLRLMGITLSIDDFGTGHSSLVKLRQIPFNELKIDRSFIQDLSSDADARTLVETILALARKLRMRVVAEGVENAEALAVLQQLGCADAQGFHISRPLAADRFTEWANRRVAESHEVLALAG